MRGGRGAAKVVGLGWRPLGRRVEVLAGLDLAIDPGERVLLAGPSGAGKSTVLQALAGALGSTVAGDLSGSVEVDGSVGLLLQNPGDAVVADRVGRDVAFGPENLGVPRGDIWRRVDSSLAAVGLDYGRDRPTSALSGGELQRLALAGVLALEPDLLLLDEPTSMLDDASAQAVRRFVLDVVERTSATMVVVEHRIEEWLPHVDRVVVLSAEGSVVADTDPATFVGEHREALGRAGVWMPGLPAPEPVAVPDALVRPERQPPTLAADDLGVDLRLRTMRGPVVAHALRGVDATLPPGEVTAFTGPSGAGKSTLVAALAGLVRPTTGRVTGIEPAPHAMRSTDLARMSGWVPQNPEHGFLTTRVRDEVALTAARTGTEVDVDAVLGAFGLSALADANPYALSGGEQRRLAVVAALAHRPGVVLLDEPTVGQDRNTWASIVGWAAGAAAHGAAVGVSTHDPDLVALADSEVRLRDGRAER